MEENSFLWISNDKGLVYNTENGKHLSFVNSKKLAPLTERLNKIDNLYCIDIDDSLLYDVEIYTWIKDMIAIKAGNLTEVGAINYKPIQYYPKLNLQFEEGRKYKSSEYITENQNYNTYLHEVTVYINGDNNGNNLYNKQIIYPQLSENTLSFNRLKSFTLQLNKFNISILNICGDPFSYNEWDDLILRLKKTYLNINLYVKSETIILNQNRLNLLFEINKLVILVDGDSDIENIVKLSEEIKSDFSKLSLCFVVKSIAEYENVSNITDQISLNCSIMPVYTGSNFNFFKDCVYFDEDDILNIKQEKRVVFSKMVLNNSFFGKLTVFSDGDVYSSKNLNRLGSIDDEISKLINKEMKGGYSWRLIRNFGPCKNCLYKFLCPSITEYDLLLNCNLCKINQNHSTYKINEVDFLFEKV